MAFSSYLLWKVSLEQRPENQIALFKLKKHVGNDVGHRVEVQMQAIQSLCLHPYLALDFGGNYWFPFENISPVGVIVFVQLFAHTCLLTGFQSPLMRYVMTLIGCDTTLICKTWR